MLIPRCLTPKRNSPSIGHKDHCVKIPKCQCSHKVISTHLRKNNRILWSHDREIWLVLTANKTSFHWTKKKQITHTLSRRRRRKKPLHWKTTLVTAHSAHSPGETISKNSKVLAVPLDQEKTKHTHNVKKKKKAVTLRKKHQYTTFWWQPRGDNFKNCKRGQTRRISCYFNTFYLILQYKISRTFLTQFPFHCPLIKIKHQLIFFTDSL